MEILGELKFDNKPDNDFKLAKDYITKHAAGFRCLGLDPACTSDEYVEICGAKVYYTKPELIYKVGTEFEKDVKTQFLNLSRKLEDNSKLLCELHTFANDKPTSKYDVQLLIQNFRYLGTEEVKNICLGYPAVYITDASPLYHLGLVGHYLYRGRAAIIYATPSSAIFSYLFTELCHQVGLHQVVLAIEQPESITEYNRIPPLWNRSVGVITSNADIDSAVDILADSEYNTAWSLKKILVQESVYDLVKKTLEWKCGWKDGLQSGEVLCYGPKKFVLDFIEPKHADCILIEAYRTTKELVSLIKASNLEFLTLWSNDIAEINEVTFKVESIIVWINAIGVFDGPLKTSQSVYSAIAYKDVLPIDRISWNGPELHTLHQKWYNLHPNERVDILKQSLDNLKDEGVKEQLTKHFPKDPFSNSSNSFVRTYDDHLWMGRDVHTHLLYFEAVYDWVFKHLIEGSGILINAENVSKELQKDFQIMLNYGVPIVVAPVGVGKNSGLFISAPQYYATKVVRQNFGTIFAN